MRNQLPVKRLVVVFTVCSGGYMLNRCVLKALFPANVFLQGYLNDMLLMPCAVPVILFIRGALREREPDAGLCLAEVLAYWALFACAFEYIAPKLIPWAVADPIDAVAYLAGGMALYLSCGTLKLWDAGCLPMVFRGNRGGSHLPSLRLRRMGRRPESPAPSYP